MYRTPYQHPAWRKVRLAVLERDQHICQVRGPRCIGRATEVDHIIPWRQNGAWLDPANLRSSCQPCNTGRVDRSQHGRWTYSPTEIVLVIGPPGSGKSTYVQRNQDLDDLVVDYDLIAQSIGSRVDHDHPESLHGPTMAIRNAMLQTIRHGKTGTKRAWIVSANPKAETTFPHHRIVLVDPGKPEVIRRARGAGRPERWIELIEAWYEKRSPAPRGDHQMIAEAW